jgi:general L-amino acid transport system permease protein
MAGVPFDLLPPPSQRYTLLHWLYRNLFSTWYNAILTILTLLGLFTIGRPLTVWLVYESKWEVVIVNIRLLMVGQYPIQQVWRVWLCLHILAALTGLSWGIWVRGKSLLALFLLALPLVIVLSSGLDPSARRHLIAIDLVALVAFGLGRIGGTSLRRIAISSWGLYLLLVILIVRGFTTQNGPAAIVPTNLWGGLLLTFLLTVVGIVFSFPLGVLLALGRRSSLPAIRWTSIIYIEVIRGVPLVTILFMAQVMLPFFLPTGTPPDRVLRAMVGITLFSAAYLAENVRGGLQAIPQGQYEAAHALGLNGFHTMAFIILPQAIRLVIPVLVGQFISLYKDTSLVATVGLLDLLGIARSVLAQPQFVGLQREVFLFITLIYWFVSYLISYISQRLEKALGVGER